MRAVPYYKRHLVVQAASSEEESPLFRTTANLPTPSPKLSEALGPADQASYRALFYGCCIMILRFSACHVFPGMRVSEDS